MLRKKSTISTSVEQQIDIDKFGKANQLSDKELKKKSEEAGYKLEQSREYHSNPNYILREIAGESVLVSVGGGVANFCGIVKLNASARVIWKALQNGATEGELVHALVDAFSIPEEQAREDAKKSLELLIQREMVVYE